MEVKIKVAYPTAKVISGFQSSVTQIPHKQTRVSAADGIWKIINFMANEIKCETSQSRFTGRILLLSRVWTVLLPSETKHIRHGFTGGNATINLPNFNLCPLAILAGHGKSTNHMC
jgi:hypothetical protein